MWVTTFLKRQIPDEELFEGGLDSAWVAYGRNYDTQKHVFVLVATGAFWNREGDPETWWVGKPVMIPKRMDTRQAIKRGMAAVMKQLPGLVKQDKIYTFGGVSGRRYLDIKDFESPRGSATNIEGWLDYIGEGKQKPIKVTIELRRVNDYDRQMVVTVDGRETVLDTRTRLDVEKKLGRKIFTKNQLDYWEGKKILTRMRSLGPLYELLKEIDLDLPKEDADKIRELLRRAGVI